MGSNTDNTLPPSRTSKETAKDFAEFFLNKITRPDNSSQAFHHINQGEQICQDLKALHHLHKKKVEQKWWEWKTKAVN